MHEQKEFDRLMARGCAASDLELARKSELVSLALHAGGKKTSSSDSRKSV